MTIPVIQSARCWLPQTQTWLFNQVRYLPQDAFDIHIVCEEAANLSQFRLPNIRALGTRKSWQWWREKLPRKLGLRQGSAFVRKQCVELGAKLVHSHFGPTGWMDSESLRNLGAKHIVSFYGVDVDADQYTTPRWRERYRAMFDRVDRVLCEGEAMRASIIRRGCAPQKVTVQHLGVELDHLEFAPRQWMPGTPMRILMTGRFVEKKGFPDALAAIGQLRNEIQVDLTIIGDALASGQEHREKARILQTIEKFGLSGNVRLLGMQPYRRILEEARNHHVFLSPSVTASDGDCEGGAPVSLVEMAAMGLIIVSTRHCDIPSVVLDGKSGLLAEEHDVKGLA